MGELVKRFPYKTTESGACEMLLDDGRCSVYERRPLLCDIKMGGVLLKVAEKDWFRLNAQACNQMIEEAGLGKEYLVSLDF
jgi:Fe-S-cluster containining protein